MNNTYKVTSYELSSRLKALGVKQDMSEKVWYCQKPFPPRILPNSETLKHSSGKGVMIDAYDVPELGKMLPEYIFSHKESSGWSCWRYPDDRDTPSFQNENEAEAMGLMLELLIKNNHIKVEDITL